MLLNYSAPRIAPNIVAAPTSNLDINSILGLTPSKYSGLQSVGDTGYYYGNNRIYEAYTPPPPSNYGYGIFGYNRPSYNPMFGYQAPSKPSYEEVTIDGQQFRTVKPDIAGFNKTALSEDDYQKDSVYEYTPSMAYVYSKAQPQVTAQPNTMFNYASGFTPATNNVYQQATGNLLTSPTMPSYTGNYGAGRFLNTGNLLGFNFTPAQTTSSPGQSPAI